MKGKISFIDQNHFLHQAVNMFFSAVKLGILTWGVYGIDSLLQPVDELVTSMLVSRERAGGCRLVCKQLVQLSAVTQQLIAYGLLIKTVDSHLNCQTLHNFSIIFHRVSHHIQNDPFNYQKLYMHVCFINI